MTSRVSAPAVHAESTEISVGQVIVGSIIEPVVLSREELNGLRNARDMFDQLRALLSEAVLPAIGGASHPVSVRITTLLSEVNLHSGGFLSRRTRDMERLAGAKEVGNGIC